MSAPTTDPSGQTTELLVQADERLADVRRRLTRHAPLFDEGAASYAAGVADAVDEVRRVLEDLDDPSA